MRRALRWIGWAVLALLLAAAALAAHTWTMRPLSVDWLYLRAFAQFALDSPELLTELRLLEPMGLRSHNAHLNDESIAAQDRLHARIRRDLAQLRAYDARGYTGQDRLSYQVFEHFLDLQARGAAWRFHDHLVNPAFGLHNELVNLLVNKHRVADATDAEHFIARLGEFPRRIDALIADLRHRQQLGIVPLKFALDQVLVQLDAFSAPSPAQHTLALAFKAKLDRIAPERLDAAARAALQARAESAIAEHAIPAYRRLAAWLREVRPLAQRNDGVWALPDGTRYYQYLIEQHTTTSASADELHRLGRADVERVGADLDRLLAQAGFDRGSRAERLAALARAPGQQYPNDDAGREQILRDYQALVDDIAGGLAPHFRGTTRATVKVVRVPPAREANAPAAFYEPPPLDRSSPARFFVNLRDLRDSPRYSMRALAYHEAIPGHHLQIATAQELLGLPIFRSLVPYTAFREGWALYSEQLAGEMGYLQDPHDRIGQLRAELLRSARLVADTGLHAQRWSREQAIDYLRQAGLDEATAVNEVERFLVTPGQALSYKVGMMKILQLRERMRAARGAQFDIRDFHDTVLRNGDLPLALLEQQVEEALTPR